MTKQTHDLPSLIGSRICHDLISPIGAIGNGLELLVLSQAVEGPEMELIGDSVANANARIRFFRISFGASTKGQTISRAEIMSILSDMTNNSRLSITLGETEDVERAEVRAIFLLLQCFETAMPHGGEIVISAKSSGWMLSATSERMLVDPGLWDVLSNPHAEHVVTPAQVQFALAPDAVEGLDRKLRIDLSESKLTAWF